MAGFLFWCIAAVIVAATIGVIVTRNPVRAALLLVVDFLALAILYVMLFAQFVAAVQVIVYAGAIMVLFLFTIMLLNISSGEEALRIDFLRAPFAIGLSAAMLVLLVGGLYRFFMDIPNPTNDDKFVGTVQTLGKSLYGQWVYPFELTSILLLVAMVGAIVMAKRRQ